MTQTAREGIARELHDLCQPLTSLACQLELGQLLGDPDSLRGAIEGALLESRRAFDAITSMRSLLAKSDAELRGAR